MKNSILNLSSAALIAAFATTTAYADTRVVTQGRSGYAIVLDQPPAAHSHRRETNVALVMDKPDRSSAKVVNFGRAGFRVVPASK